MSTVKTEENWQDDCNNNILLFTKYLLYQGNALVI